MPIAKLKQASEKQTTWRWVLGGAVVVGVAGVLCFRLSPLQFSRLSAIADLLIKLCGVVAVLYVYGRHQRKKHDLDIETLELQRQAAVDRGELALTVELDTTVTPHGAGFFIRPTVIVKNASSKLFRVPAVYITGRLVPVDVLPSRCDWGDLVAHEALRTTNAAEYGTVMVSLAPEETEQFTTWFYLSPDLVTEYPSVIVRVDVVGAEQGRLGDVNYCARFVEWMERSGAHSYIAFSNWPAGIYETLSQSQQVLPRGRCLMLRPTAPDATPVEVDIASTSEWRELLHKGTMMWDRYFIVPLRATAASSEPGGIEAPSTSLVETKDDNQARLE